MTQCLRLHNGNFSYYHNWKLTSFYPRDPRPQAELDRAFRPVIVRDFSSDFLYRRWCRCHMDLGDAFLLPSEEQGPAIRRLQKIDAQDLTFQDFYEQYSRVPFVICNAMGEWKASKEWTMQKLIEQFPSDVKHRVTHNLDIISSSSTMEMSFADYFKYASSQHDETPLYIFDAKFGEKMPSLLADYRIEDLKVFKEDFLSVSASPDKLDGKDMLRKGVKLEAGGKKVLTEKKKKRAAGSVRPEFRWIVIGPQRTGAPWHQDPARTSAWNALVKGRKRWAIYPPDTLPPGVNVGKNGEYRDSGVGMPSLIWYLHVYPTLVPDQKPLEIIQEEGETIYVPNGWWHLVLNLDMTIAVTQNMVDSHNVLMFMKDMVNDGQDEALEILQHELKKTRPETFDIFRLVQIPRMSGFLSEEAFQQSFCILEHWKPQIKRILKRHKVLVVPDTTQHVIRKVKYPRMKSLTSRVNPTFAVGKRLLVKFFSQYNENWGEFDFETYMTPNFDSTSDECMHPSKRRKQSVLPPYELKNAMTLRCAMEECFRVERAVYQMLDKGVRVDPLRQSLQAMTPRLHYSGHLLYPDEVDDNEGEGLMWRWPYLIVEYKCSGVGLDVITKKGGVTRDSWNKVAAWISQEFLPKLHSVPIDPELRGICGHSKFEWDWYIHYMLHRRKRAVSFHLIESSLPPHLQKLLENFLPAASNDALVSQLLPVNRLEVKPVLLHGDLTDENILGSEVDGRQRNKVASSSANEQQTRNLSSFLKSIGCEEYISLLAEQEKVTLESLSLLDEAHLKKLGIPLGPRVAILKSRQRIATHARVIDDKIDTSNCGYSTEEEWETSSGSSNSSGEEESEIDVTTPVGQAAIEAKRKEKFVGPHEWIPTSVIDFADAKTGDPLYDLVAVFFAALHCDRELWKVTLASEYWQEYIRREKQSSILQRRCLRERFLQLVLLHPSHSAKGLFHYFPQAAQCATWEGLAHAIFDDLF
uniref:JmjC domain-containing protein n=1 Tax=Hyaloperonospora arabidopsidis (strain Emoy2) TaxID=559515 RepID=M4C1U1_HYAAE